MARKHFMLDRREIPKSAHKKALWNIIFKIREGFSFQIEHVKCNGQSRIEAAWQHVGTVLFLGWVETWLHQKGIRFVFAPPPRLSFTFVWRWFGGVILLKTYHTDFWLTNNYTIDKINSFVYKQLLGAAPRIGVGEFLVSAVYLCFLNESVDSLCTCTASFVDKMWNGEVPDTSASPSSNNSRA